MNSEIKTSVGKRGKDVHSDCYIELELTEKGGLNVELKSKVDVMYGESIKMLILGMCDLYNIRHANIYMEDFGALNYTIMARFELAVKKLHPDEKRECIPDFNKKNNYKTTKDKLRRSRLYLPGNEPKFYINAGLHNPDGIILDLEDSVAHSEKDAAQLIVRNALRRVDFYGAERMVRINQLPKGLDDLEFIVPHNVHVILIPKAESKSDIQIIEERVLKIKEEHKIKNDIYFMPIIESAKGVVNAYEIASASIYNCALAVGLEDYTADIGTERTSEGTESFYARSAIMNAAKAAKIQAIDTVYSDVSDMEGLRKSVLEAKSLGFEGKGCIHPRQIKIINEAFLPNQKEIEKAKKIVLAFEEAEAKGFGVVSLGSKMIDAPVVKRARRIVKLAEENKLLEKDWRNQN